MSGDRRIFAFVGQNANGILEWLTRQILEYFKRRGFSYHLFDLCGANWEDELCSNLNQGLPTFCFSFQGMGVGLKDQHSTNFWVANKVPFFTCLRDAPYHAPELHEDSGPGIYRLHASDDFLLTYRRYFDGRGFSTLHPFGYPANLKAREKIWARRENSIVYVKTGADCRNMRDAWSIFPPIIQRVIHDAADVMLSGTDKIVADVVAESFKASGLWYGERMELFSYVCSSVDTYVRMVRAEKVVRVLMRYKSLIVGEWEHIDKVGAKAIFVKNLPATELDALYSNTKVVINTQPCVRHGLHERIMAGLHAGCAVISDSTSFLQEFFEGVPSLSLFDVNSDSYDDALQDALRHAERSEELVYAYQPLIADRLSLENFCEPLLRLLEVHHSTALSSWDTELNPMLPR